MKKHDEIHVPGPSFWPVVLAAGLALIAIGVVSTFIFSVVGILVLLAAVGGWAMENRAQGDSHE